MDDAEEIAAATRLGQLLTRLRKGGNLTQRELGRRAGLSWTFVQLLEKGVRADTGRPVTPSPQSLHKVANGLAVDAIDREKKNPGVAAGLFKQLMEARGWSTDDAPPAEPAAPTVEELREALASFAGADAGAELLNLARCWYQLSSETRRFLLGTIRYTTTREGQALAQSV